MYFIHNTGGGKEGKKDRRSTHTEKNEWEKKRKEQNFDLFRLQHSDPSTFSVWFESWGEGID